MRKLSKRFLSMLIALALVLSLVPAIALADENTNSVTKWNVTLKDNIGANFYLRLDDPANTVVNFTVAGEVTSIPASDAPQKDGCYVFTVELAAAQMTDDIKLDVLVNDGSVFSETHSIKEYANLILAGNYSAEVKSMVLTMLHYGAAAQTYFSYNLGSLANAGCDELTPTGVPASESDVGESSKTGTVSGISYYGASLVFQSRVAVRYYFTLDAESTISDYTFKVGDTTYTPVAKGGRYYVEIPEIYPQNLNKQYTLTVTKDTETLSVTYGPLNYMVRQNNNASSSETLKNLVQMLYTYHTESVNYLEYLQSKADAPTQGNIVELHMDKMAENGKSFITKKTYPAGTTITFKAYQPDVDTSTGNEWWGVNYTTGADGRDIYSGTQSLYSASKVGRWNQYSYTLPEGIEDSYIFFGGAKNNVWADKPLLIDDVVITEPDKDPVTDDFEYGLAGGLFAVNNTNAIKLRSFGEVDVTPTEGHYVTIYPRHIKENGTSFITKEAYASGSVLKFQANVSFSDWWVIGFTKDASNGSVYPGGNNLNMVDVTSAGKWSNYAVTVPDGGPYYILFAAAPGGSTPAENKISLDNVTIIQENGTVVTDDFENGLTGGLFNAIEKNNYDTAVELIDLGGSVTVTAQEALEDLKASYGETIASGTELPSTWNLNGTEFTVNWTVSGAASLNGNQFVLAVPQNEAADYTLTATVSNGKDTASYSWNGTVNARGGNVAALNINKLNENAPMSFITKEAYAGGSTVTFDAYVPTGASWWAVCWATDPSQTDLYKWTGGEAYGKSMSSVTGQWAEYSVTLPDDSNSYYIYIVGAKGEWKDGDGQHVKLLLDDVVITEPGKTPVTDGFENGLTGGLFDVNSENTAELLNLDPVTVTAQEALEDLKASYGETIASGTELASAWTVNGNHFTVTWEVTSGASVASVSGGKLVLTPPSDATTSYMLKATVAKGGDTASYSWIDSVKPQANTVAAISIDQLREGAPMSFITKATYAGGSTVTFDAYVPSGTGWWAVCWTTDPSNTDLYKWTGGEAYGKSMASVTDQWAEYSVTLPNDSNSYYIYIVGAKGEWNGKQLLIDNVVITKSGSTVASDDFEGTSLFTFNEGAALQTIGGAEETPMAGNYAAIHVDYLNADAPMSFITKDAYPGGSTVTFQGYVPSDTSWWAVCWTTDPSNTDLYKWTGGEAYGKSMTSTPDQWAEYSVTLPNDSNSYYIYIVGAKGEWKDKALLIDDVVITAPDGAKTSENFENGLDSSIFSYTAKSSAEDTIVALGTYNYAAEIQMSRISTGVDFITRNAYPAGSTVTFDAKVPSGASWWALDWTTDPGTVNNGDAVYNHANGNGVALNSFAGKWSNYTVKLPETGGSYHLYIAGTNEWGSNTLLIDNFKIIGPDGTVLAEENFNHALSDSIFCTCAAVSMSEVLSYTENENAEIQFTAYAAPTVNRGATEAELGAISAAYSKLANAGFNKAIALYEGLNGNITATDLATIKAQIAQRSAYTEQVSKLIMEKAQKFGITYYAKDWTLYGMGGLNTDEYGLSADLANKAGIHETEFQNIINSMFASGNAYSGNGGYAGHFGFDEPYYSDMEKVGWMAKYYKATGIDGDLFVNLLPPYVDKNSPQLGAESKWEQWFGNYTYENYLNEYLNQTNGSLDYICWDYYPFLKNDSSLSDEQTVRTQKYLYSYELMAKKAAANNRELRVVIQSSGDSVGVRNLNGKSELSFQIYSGLAFGVKEFIYYQYSGDSTSGYDYIHNYDTQTYNDTVYGWAQDVNNAVHSFEEVYDEYTWSNVMKVDSDNSNIMMNNLTSAVTSHDKIKVEGEGDYLVGLFTAKDSASTRQNAFMIVNADSDPGAAAQDIVLTMAGASAVSIYRNGEQTVMKLNDTQCILTDVQPGEGIFVVPLY